MRVLIAATFIIGLLGLLVSITLPYKSAIYVLFFALGCVLIGVAITGLAWGLHGRRRE